MRLMDYTARWLLSAVVDEKSGIGGRDGFAFAVFTVFTVFGDLGDAFPSDRRLREHDDGRAGYAAAFDGAAIGAGSVDKDGGVDMDGDVDMDGAVDVDLDGLAMDATLTE
ncbi:hypothetical protein F503_07082 [Ophiostoma piceae UAMH 11346]|uniref:Uncharacterized protein n=1 Tax=Ophiostoma piceae (strain UAMH 11346) TaxID=1262450 RepID=S3CBI1_OPHP1|nr:hypothetical protein F503_07082 [Ophiostoma piceae UAMH 11346]